MRRSRGRPPRRDTQRVASPAGWDWAPYTTTYLEDTWFFSKGLWKSVYLATSTSGVFVTHVTPQIAYARPRRRYSNSSFERPPPEHSQTLKNDRKRVFVSSSSRRRRYAGAYPVEPLANANHGGFDVAVRVHLDADRAVENVNVEVSGAWASQSTSKTLNVDAGASMVSLDLPKADAVDLWWPNGLGEQPTYVRRADIPQTAVAATSRPRRAFFCGDKFWRHDGRDVDIPWRPARPAGTA